jgi:flavin reductase (DIM6/NTAB) family NADH-FMN oxidoreductase RutF
MATSYAPSQPGALQDAFREVMASVCTPVSVVTAMSGDRPHGTTVSAFASLSMNPPMVVVSLDLGSELLAVVRQTGQFGLNVLGSGQSALAMTFARKGGAAKFANVPWEAVAGVPRIPDAGGFLVCSVARLVPGGDHVIVLGDVLGARPAPGQPLTYHARGFGTHVALEGQLT